LLHWIDVYLFVPWHLPLVDDATSIIMRREGPPGGGGGRQRLVLLSSPSRDSLLHWIDVYLFFPWHLPLVDDATSIVTAGGGREASSLTCFLLRFKTPCCPGVACPEWSRLARRDLSLIYTVCAATFSSAMRSPLFTTVPPSILSAHRARGGQGVYLSAYPSCLTHGMRRRV
jgi:hypothetical protein